MSTLASSSVSNGKLAYSRVPISLFFQGFRSMRPEMLSLAAVPFTEGAGQLPDSTSLTSPVVTSKYRVPGGNSNSKSASFNEGLNSHFSNTPVISATL